MRTERSCARAKELFASPPRRGGARLLAHRVASRRCHDSKRFRVDEEGGAGMHDGEQRFQAASCLKLK